MGETFGEYVQEANPEYASQLETGLKRLEQGLGKYASGLQNIQQLTNLNNYGAYTDNFSLGYNTKDNQVNINTSVVPASFYVVSGGHIAVYEHEGLTPLQTIEAMLHENIHAGLLGFRILDEGLVQWLTKKIMKDVFGVDNKLGAYEDEVAEIERFLDRFTEDCNEMDFLKAIMSDDFDKTLSLAQSAENLIAKVVAHVVAGKNEVNLDELTYSSVIDDIQSLMDVLNDSFVRSISMANGENGFRNHRDTEDFRARNVADMDAVLDILKTKVNNQLANAPTKFFEMVEKMCSEYYKVEMAELGRIDSVESMRSTLEDLGLLYLFVDNEVTSVEKLYDKYRELGSIPSTNLELVSMAATKNNFSIPPLDLKAA